MTDDQGRIDTADVIVEPNRATSAAPAVRGHYALRDARHFGTHARGSAPTLRRPTPTPTLAAAEAEVVAVRSVSPPSSC